MEATRDGKRAVGSKPLASSWWLVVVLLELAVFWRFERACCWSKASRRGAESIIVEGAQAHSLRYIHDKLNKDAKSLLKSHITLLEFHNAMKEMVAGNL